MHRADSYINSTTQFIELTPILYENTLEPPIGETLISFTFRMLDHFIWS
jgi:hypothetical protein